MEKLDTGVLFILGLGVFGGMLGARLFQRLRIPQVIGYIAIGLAVGQSGLGIITRDHVATLQPFSLFALGIIGFLVGGELQLATFRKYARQFTAILFGEGLGAFFLVGIPATLLMYFVLGSWPIAAATGIVFGAIASATDPASTMDVLWEYRSQGVLTTSIIAVVALDDALAMVLYGLGTSVAQVLISGGTDIRGETIRIAIALLGAIGLGVLSALVLRFMLGWIHQTERNVALAVGVILLAISVSATYGMDIILATMALGFCLTNLEPRRSKDVFALMRSFSVPIYVLFFVLVGARLGIAQMPLWLWALVAIYVIGRSVGKIAGAYLGARLTRSPAVVRRYMGFGLFTQGGVAVGLSIMASSHLGAIALSDEMAIGDVVIFGVTATTLILQLLGPPMVKLAIVLANEAGRNLTEEDVIATLRVADVMDSRVAPVPEHQPLSEAIQTLANDDYLVYPVVDRHGHIAGILSMDNLKQVLADQDVWQWLLVADVMAPVEYKATAGEPLQDVLNRMRDLKLDEMVVVQDGNGAAPQGLVDIRYMRKRIDEELLRRRNPAAQPLALDH
jgi:Kef-type K+ transport system membrane component KefB